MDILFLWILLGIVLLLCIPVVLELKYHEDLMVWVKVLWFRKQLLPAPVKPKKQKKEQPKPPAEKKPKEEKDLSFDFKEIWKMAQELLPKLWRWVKWLVGKIKFYDLDIGILVARGDAATTAIALGQVQAYLHGVLGLLRNFFDIRPRTLLVQPDFTGDTDQHYVYFKVRIIPIIVLIAAVNILIAAFGPVMQLIKGDKKTTTTTKEKDVQ